MNVYIVIITLLIFVGVVNLVDQAKKNNETNKEILEELKKQNKSK
jgi:hypothetical protein